MDWKTTGSQLWMRPLIGLKGQSPGSTASSVSKHGAGYTAMRLLMRFWKG